MQECLGTARTLVLTAGSYVPAPRVSYPEMLCAVACSPCRPKPCSWSLPACRGATVLILQGPLQQDDVWPDAPSHPLMVLGSPPCLGHCLWRRAWPSPRFVAQAEHPARFARPVQLGALRFNRYREGTALLMCCLPSPQGAPRAWPPRAG